MISVETTGRGSRRTAFDRGWPGARGLMNAAVARALDSRLSRTYSTAYGWTLDLAASELGGLRASCFRKKQLK